MCDICSDILEILESRDSRNSDRCGILLTKKEITNVILYTQLWPQQRQCMCCYTDIKNFSRFNNVIQLTLAQAIQFIETLTQDGKSSMMEDDEVDVTGLETASKTSRDSTEDGADERKTEASESRESWTLEEKDRLFQFVSKVFSPGFPLYLAFKHRVPTSLEELAKHDASVLSNYCELNDPDVPLLLLRNVCYFCDSNGFRALAQCFKDSKPETLSLSLAHTLVTVCANVRMWMNYRAAAKFMSMIRQHIIGYMCHFTEKDLRSTMARSMTELVWQALKDSRDLSNQAGVVTFDKEGLDLAYKFFTCSTLTLRLAGIAQINSQINMYTEYATGDGVVEVESVGTQLSDWLIENKIIEQIFGPNLHVEIIKQSQVILNFLALECRFTNEHIDVIWGASQLKHCGKQVLDILAMMVKSMDLMPAQHLHGLMQQLEPTAHTEQTLMLASTLTKFLWVSVCARQNHPTLTLVTRHHGNQPQVFAVTTQPMADDADLVDVAGEILKQNQFSSSRSDSDDEEEDDEDDDDDADGSGNELEMGEVKQLRHHHHHQLQHHHFSDHHLQHHRLPHLTLASSSSPLKECWSDSMHHAGKISGQHPQGRMIRNRRFKSSSTDGQRSEEQKSGEDEDDEEEDQGNSVNSDDDDDGENMSPPKARSSGKKTSIKMTRKVKRKCVSQFLKLQKKMKQNINAKFVRHHQWMMSRKQRYTADNESEGKQHRRNAESSKKSASKTDQVMTLKRKPKMIRSSGLRKGRIMKTPYSLSGIRNKVQRTDDASDDGANKKESDDEQEEVSDFDVDGIRVVSKDGKPSEEEDDEEEENVEMEDEGKEKSSSGSPSSSSSGSVSSCEDERVTVKEGSMKKVCLTSSPEILQANVSVSRPSVRKNHSKVAPVAVRLEKEGDGSDCHFELSSSDKGKVTSKALRHETSGKMNVKACSKTETIEQAILSLSPQALDICRLNNKPSISQASLFESSSPGVVVSDEIDGSHFVGEDGLVSTPDKLAYLQQHLKHRLEGITVQESCETTPRQIHIFHQHESKGGICDESSYHLSQSLVDPSMSDQQVLKLDVVVTRALADSSSEERMLVMPGCNDDDVAVVSDAVLLGAYTVKDACGMMQFDDEGNKGITAEELEACLDSTTGESGVILLKQNQSMTGNLVEDILSPEATSNSSRLTNKSEKNMSDFEGEDAISDEELVTINAQSQYVGIHPMQQQLANMASLYHHHHHHHHHHGHHHVHAHHLHEMFHEAQINSGGRELSSDGVKLNELCQPQNTIIWNLLQDHNIDKLQDGLASEAEKNLSSLVCLTNDRIVKSKFIEACIANLSQNKSVVISLRLLSKVLNSFNQHRGPPATHHMTIWAENELQMTKHFFNNILYYTRAAKQNVNMHNIFSHKEEIQARLQFLTCVFSSNGSPDVFRLNTEQVDILWDCLATDTQCSDDFLQWIYNQTKNKDYHALKLDTLKHIFMEKMPQLKPEETSMIGLNLFTQLCHLAFSTSGDPSMTTDQAIGIDQLWEIALRAKNTDVSMNAISVLNHHYISIGSVALEKEGSFVEKCMKSLMTASNSLNQNADGSLLVMQRALILLTNHLESFHKQHAYHLRLFQLNNQMVQSRFSPGKHLSSSLSSPQKIRVILQTGNSNARTAIEVSPNDLVAELRAEVTHWWETTHNKSAQHPEKEDGSSGSKTALQPLLNSVFSYGSVRMITQGQELSSQVDDKTLAEMQFKDHQLVFASQGGSRSSKRVDCQQLISSLYKLPMILLTEEPHFTCLFNLLQQLSSFLPNYSDGDLQEQCSLQTKARVLSRKVWSLLMLLPTNKKMLEAFNSISCDTENSTDWEELLNPMNPHKLMYSLLIIESLSKPFKGKSKSYKLSAGNVQTYEEQHDNTPDRQWKNKFIGSGGFQHLLSILLSGVLQEHDGGKRDEWQNDCLACLLLLINLFAISHCDVEMHQSELFDMLDSPAKKTGKRRVPERLIVPCVNESILSQMDVEAVVKALMSTMFNAATPRRDCDRLTMTSWAHIDVVRHSMSLLVSLAYSSPVILSTFVTSENFSSWLKRMTLEALEPAIRQESCQGLYKLCLGRTSDGQLGYKYLIPVFNSLLPCLTDACSIKSVKKGQSAVPSYGKGHDDKEPYGPGCRDYLWLMCQLVDGIKKEDAERSWCQSDTAGGSRQVEEESCNKKTHLVDLSNVTQMVASRIISRGFFEKRHNTVEDDGLVGLAKLCTSLLKHNPPFKTSANGQSFLVDVFHCLFALPSPSMRYLPKCKSQSARTAAYDLLVELVKSNIESYIILHGLLLKQNNKDSHTPYSWDTWPHDEERSKCGYVGLTNLGATCYMATCMQHLFMIHEARKTILEAKCSENTNHIGILLELKKMFAYLLESERKAYNPYSFCKVYTMDHQPLNTGEQKDMTEFFTDLITKLEEMGPELKSMVKSLFGGVLTNNVVSLDCPHVSRTKEEFYTVRCQVADMKNLYESLDEVTVKDMLEGDNMYTCSKCQKKVRAEKRACFCKLPTILCFNTMRYTFNMITMMKEKVNTHFSFPLKLDMSPYMEANLIHRQHNNDERDKCANSAVSDLDLDEATCSAIDAALQEDNLEDPGDLADGKGYEYELIGVTVHTGTADAGHYYSFIRDRTNKNEMGQDRWYLFNDAEVKPFDPAQLASECFGGETTSKTYDSVTEKFMDFSFEKVSIFVHLSCYEVMTSAGPMTNIEVAQSVKCLSQAGTHSAYMLFYERINVNPSSSMTPNKTASLIKEALLGAAMTTSSSSSSPSGSHKNEEMVGAGSGPFIGGDDDDLAKCKIELSPDLAEWIWQDNTQFLQDKNIFEHSYFSFMWQMCNYIPTTLPRNNPNIQVSLLATKLSASFILETLIHAKEKPTMLQWIENTTKLFQSDRRCCEWFLDTITEDDWWPQQILIRCPNQTVRQMFQRLVLHVINQVKPAQGKNDDDPDTSRSVGGGGDDTCVNRFIRKMLAILEQDNRLHCRYLGEYFGLILDYAKTRDSECRFLNQINTISILVGFFMSLKQHGDYMSTNDMSDDDSERDVDDIMNQPDDKYHPPALEKMITLVALLVEKSRAEHKNLQLSEKDMHALLGGRHFPFLFHQIRDSINLRQTCNLIFSLSRYNDRLASNVIQIILNSVVKSGVEIQPFFKLLTMLVEFNGGPPGMPMFLQYVLEKFWQMAEICPHPALDWLSTLVVRNKVAMSWTLQTMNQWMEFFLMAVSNLRVRNAAANLLISLVPNNNFRQTYRNSRNVLIPHKEPITMSEEATEVLHEVYGHLLKLLCKARQYVDGQGQGTSKLVAYFSVLNYCLISKTEKLMFSRYFPDLWSLFQPKLSDPQIAINHNKQAMMIFWYHVCLDCPENVKLIVSNPNISKNIAFNYILVDHEDQEVIVTNRTMLPAYYGILRMCCAQSPSFTRQLAQHQNIQWAFRNITTHPAQYTAAVDELYRLMQLMVAINPGMSDEDMKAVVQFRRNTIQMYLQILDARNQWQTLVAVFGILLDRDEERIFALQHNGLMLMYDAFCTLHMMHYEATACHVVDDIVHLLNVILQTLSSARKYLTEKKVTDVKPHLTAWKDRTDFVKKLLSLLNFFTPPEMRKATFACLREMILIYQFECIQTIVPILAHAHTAFQASSDLMPVGTYFPRLGQKQAMSKATIRTPRPQFQMFLHINQVESKKGVDPAYDQLLYEAFEPYHHLVDLLLRVAVNQQNLPDAIVKLSAMVASEGTPLHLPYFAKLWYEIYQTESVDRKWVEVLCSCQSFVEYVDSVLTNERTSLNNPHIFQFFCNFFPKIHHKVLTDQNVDLIATIISSIDSNRLHTENEHPSAKEMERIWSNINGDLKAMQIILSVQGSNKISPSLAECFKCFQQQFLRTLQIHQQQSSSASSSQFRSTSQLRPSTSTTPVNSKKTPHGSGSDSVSPKLLFSIVTGKTPTKKRRVGAKGESEDVYHSSASSSSSGKSNAAASVFDESSSKRAAKRPLDDNDYDDDDGSSKGKEFSYVVNSAIDVNFDTEKVESTCAASFPSPVINEVDPASIPEIPSSSLTTLHTAPALQSTSYDSLQEGTSGVQQDDDMDVSDDNDEDDDDDDLQEGNFKSGRSSTTGDRALPSLLHGKEKPSLIDSVIKNADAVLKLILDRVNEKE